MRGIFQGQKVRQSVEQPFIGGARVLVCGFRVCVLALLRGLRLRGGRRVGRRGLLRRCREQQDARKQTANQSSKHKYLQNSTSPNDSSPAHGRSRETSWRSNGTELGPQSGSTDLF